MENLVKPLVEKSKKLIKLSIEKSKDLINLLIKKLEIFNQKNKNNKIFKQLPEENERQVFFSQYKSQIKGTISLICVSSLVLTGSFMLDYLDHHENNLYPTSSYTVVFDGNEVCKIRDPKLFDTTLEKVQKDLEKQSNLDIVVENKIELVKSNARDKEVLSQDELYNKLKSEIHYSRLAYSIDVNGTNVGIVQSKDEANDIINEVKNHFTEIYDKNTILEVDTAEDVKIQQVKVINKDIQKPEDVVNYIIKGTKEDKKYIVEEGDTYWTIAEYFNMSLDDLISANPSANPDMIQIGDELNLVVPKPFLNVQVKRKVIQEEKIPYETKYEYVSYLYNDEEVVKEDGKYGLSQVEAVVTDQNGIQIAKDVLSENVVEQPSAKVVITGTQDPPPSQGTGYFANPLPGSYISSPFGSRSGGFHMGQDMAKSAGSSIKAADGGTVVFAGWQGSYGYMIEIDHGGGFSTRYAHCSAIYVKCGEKVYQGKVIGAVGQTGVATGPHLHFEVRKYGKAVNPSSYIGVQYR